MGVGGQPHAPAASTPGKTQYPLYRRLGGPQGRSGRAENLVPTGIRSRTVQPVVSRYTDWAIPAHCLIVLLKLFEWPKAAIWSALIYSITHFSVYIYLLVQPDDGLARTKRRKAAVTYNTVICSINSCVRRSLPSFRKLVTPESCKTWRGKNNNNNNNRQHNNTSGFLFTVTSQTLVGANRPSLNQRHRRIVQVGYQASKFHGAEFFLRR